MSKSFTIKMPKATIRNAIARELIMSGNGKTQVHRDKRDRRSKDARHKREMFEDYLE